MFLAAPPARDVAKVAVAASRQRTVSSPRRALRAAVLLAAHAVVLQDDAVILPTFLAPMITFAARLVISVTEIRVAMHLVAEAHLRTHLLLRRLLLPLCRAPLQHLREHCRLVLHHPFRRVMACQLPHPVQLLESSPSLTAALHGKAPHGLLFLVHAT